jgi:hypothetical protein
VIKWEFKGTAPNQFLIEGEDIFKEKWINTGEKAEVKNPLYSNERIFTIWKVERENRVITFVAGELSNGVFGIWM